MTHEFKNIVEEALQASKNGLQSVLATVVALDGSSYRKPGVRMLIKENGEMIGAVSGGCVEKEILLQSESVFKTGVSKVITYDGRYRLGCEGVLYILIERFKPSEAFHTAFSKCLRERKLFQIVSYFEKRVTINSGFGSFIKLNNELFPIYREALTNDDFSVFKQNMTPCFKLVIIGAEHDAVELCKYASLTGWEVTILAGVSESKSIDNFPGAIEFTTTTAEAMDTSLIDNQTAVVLMTHNFAKDLRYLVALKDVNPNYIGILGPTKRRDDLLSHFMEYCPDINLAFLDSIHGPAGLNIGSETPQEIAISIMSEILAFSRKQNPVSLSSKSGRIHTS